MNKKLDDRDDDAPRRVPVTFDPTEKDKRNLKPITGSEYGDFSEVRLAQVIDSLHLDEAGKEQYEQRIRAVIATMKGVAPGDELEGMLAAQLAATHDAGMECLRRGMRPDQPFDWSREQINQANKLFRTHTMLLDALNRHRGKRKQQIRVEHVHVHEGGQAIVGVVNHSKQHRSAAQEEADATGLIEHRPDEPMRCADPQRELVPVAAGHREEAL